MTEGNSPQTVRLKMRTYTKSHNYGDSFGVKMSVVGGTTEENEKFFKATPSGSLEFNSINMNAAKMFEPGKEYYVDITEVVPE